MSSNTFLIDAASRRAVLLQRYSAGLEGRLANSVSVAIRSAAVDVQSLDGSDTRVRLEVINNYRAELTNAEAELYDELLALANEEAEFSAEMFEEAINADIRMIDEADLVARVNRSNISVISGQSVTIPSMLSQFTEVKSRQINTIIQDGFVEGLTTDQIARRMLDVQPIQKRQAETIARTGTNAVSSIARYGISEENKDVLLGYEWVSTLDNRTSNICIARDGVVYEFAESNPKPPAHFGCRSTIVPKVDPQYDLLSDVQGDRPSKGADGTEIVSAKSTYGGWLRKQPAGFQDEVLGPARAKLFRQGGLSVDKFVNFDGRTYTLDELRRLHPVAFDRANL